MTGGLVMASHGVLDAFTDGGLGVALFWPATDARFFAPWRPIPVSPLGWRVLSPEGLGIILRECVLFLPAWLVVLWPGKR
jgi:inner membrane protein